VGLSFLESPISSQGNGKEKAPNLEGGREGERERERKRFP